VRKKMEHKLSKGKRTPKGRTAAAVRKAGATRQAKRLNQSQVALATLMALLHADRWLFEAGELARKAGLEGEIEAFNGIRLSIVKSLNRLQPRAYGAMSRDGYLNVRGQ
jgi:hypothetical protein